MPLNSAVVKQERNAAGPRTKAFAKCKIPPPPLSENAVIPAKPEGEAIKKMSNVDIVKEYLSVSRNNRSRVMTRSKSKAESAFEDVLAESFCDDFDRIFDNVWRGKRGKPGDLLKRARYVPRVSRFKMLADERISSFYKRGCKTDNSNLMVQKSLSLYDEIVVNVNHKLLRDKISSVCYCKNDPDNVNNKFICNLPSVCLNRATFVECKPEKCDPKLSFCLNQRIRKSKWPGVGLKYFENKGVGVIATQTIVPQQFICEYLGEIIDKKTCEHRLRETYKSKGHSYIFCVTKKYFIDATKYGNFSRFINHSCEPNTKAEVWKVSDESTLAFFATKEIGEGEEITFDYNYDNLGLRKQRCFCGAKCCRGYVINYKKLKFERIKKNNKLDLVKKENPYLENERGRGIKPHLICRFF